MSSKIEQLRKKYTEMLCPYLKERKEDYPCDKARDQCNAADCEVYKIVVDMGAY